jgi:parallel beta-helix repeat protein
VTITEDSRLVGDVTCTDAVVKAPCIVIGASHVKLSLNGFTITGPVDPLTDLANCSVPAPGPFGVGVEVVGQTDVKIEGPGIVQKFQRWGIFLLSSTRVTVKHVTATYNCWSGMQTGGVSESNFEENTWANNAVGSHGAPCGGICLASSNKNLIRKSTFSGNGTVNAPDGNVDFGVGLEGTSSGNQIEGNDVDGNTNGVFVVDSTATGNVVRRNRIFGNPSAQVSVAFPSTGTIFTSAHEQGFDIQDTSPAGANAFEDNLCLTYSGAASPAPCPNVVTKDNDEARNGLANPMRRSEGPNRKREARSEFPLLAASASLLGIVFWGARRKSAKSRI